MAVGSFAFLPLGGDTGAKTPASKVVPSNTQLNTHSNTVNQTGIVGTNVYGVGGTVGSGIGGTGWRSTPTPIPPQGGSKGRPQNCLSDASDTLVDPAPPLPLMPPPLLPPLPPMPDASAPPMPQILVLRDITNINVRGQVPLPAPTPMHTASIPCTSALLPIPQ